MQRAGSPPPKHPPTAPLTAVGAASPPTPPHPTPVDPPQADHDQGDPPLPPPHTHTPPHPRRPPQTDHDQGDPGPPLVHEGLAARGQGDERQHTHAPRGQPGAPGSCPGVPGGGARVLGRVLAPGLRPPPQAHAAQRLSVCSPWPRTLPHSPHPRLSTHLLPVPLARPTPRPTQSEAEIRAVVQEAQRSSALAPPGWEDDYIDDTMDADLESSFDEWGGQ